jgi:hypothetical protein
MHDTFKFIYKRDNSRGYDGDALESKYTNVQALAGRFIVKNDAGYRVYKSADDFVCAFDDVITERDFHEVIFNNPQKLKFDIDAPRHKVEQFIDRMPDDDEYLDKIIDIDDPDILDLLVDINIDIVPVVISTEDKYKGIFNTILSAIKDNFYITYGVDLAPDDIIICESLDPTGEKFSNHIIINNYCVSSCYQADAFTKSMAETLPMIYKTFLDMGINKQVQNFRLAKCHKTGQNRVKQIMSNHTIIDTFISHTSGCKMLDDIVKPLEAQASLCTRLNCDEIDSVKSIYSRDEEIMANHRLKKIQGTRFLFDRVAASICDFCGREHTSDNTLVVLVMKNDDATSVFKMCRKYIDENGKTGKHLQFLGSFGGNTATNGSALTNGSLTYVDNIILKECAKISSRGPIGFDGGLFRVLPARCQNTYDEPEMRPFELTRTLVVRAAMKMGKTKMLVDHIRNHFSSGISEPIIRFVSFRQTFSANIKEKFADFTLYSDVKGPLVQPRLIVQVESLHRLRLGPDPPDLLVLDECESIFEQIDSGLLKGNFNEAFAKLQYMLKYSKHVILMDAFVSDRTYRILAQMRPWKPSPAEMIFHNNIHQNAVNETYYLCGFKPKWLGVLYSSILADKRVAIAISSLAEAETLEHDLSATYPDKRIKIYSSKTAPSEKKAHFGDVNKYWSVYDVLIYTPTVSAGVSFEAIHFDIMFGYFTDKSCGIETCMQMLGRIRNISDHITYIYISAFGGSAPASIPAIIASLRNKRDNLSRIFDVSGLQITYDINGEPLYHEGDYYTVWLENTLVRNLSHNYFAVRFVNIIARTGASVNALSDEDFENATGGPVYIGGLLSDELQVITDGCASSKAVVSEEKCHMIAIAADLTDDEVESIKIRMRAQEDIATADIAALAKFKMRADYKYSGTIDVDFVKKYDAASTRRIFKNLVRIKARRDYPDTALALATIKEDERSRHVELMSIGQEAHQRDLTIRYVYDQHRYALGYLRMVGFSSLYDGKYISDVTLAENMTEGAALYWATIPHACAEFSVKAPSYDAAARLRSRPRDVAIYMLKPINAILVIMYGRRVKQDAKDSSMFYLWQTPLFTDNPTAAASKNIPLIYDASALCVPVDVII